MALLIHKNDHSDAMIMRNGGLAIFSDGSYKCDGPGNQQHGGYGVYIPSQGVYQAHGRRPQQDLKRCSAITFELLGLLESLQMAIMLQEKGGGVRHHEVFVYTDSYDSLTLLEMYMENSTYLSRHSDVSTMESIVLFAGMLRCNVHFCKVKGHDKVLGNEVADKLAKIGATLLEGQQRRCTFVGDLLVPLIPPGQC
ncbi:hypothetical protein SELMODRAFT_409945 [Selaginella moellendorffii]|uniref:RNase H type-1 domain-containing protein n=1 Tax=Selaginella moellendorffii TaxID=88036 RepID=D8RCZ1_SELML|nr:hypothetical protein SELMODRAFT_409945 [Selaginella moellendorffii]